MRVILISILSLALTWLPHLSPIKPNNTIIMASYHRFTNQNFYYHRSFPVIVRDFDPPAQKWLAGHRGIDLKLPDTKIYSFTTGLVVYRGQINGIPILTVESNGERITYQPISSELAVGSQVRFGQFLGLVQGRHEGCDFSNCLHLGRKIGETYLDPKDLLILQSIRLLSNTKWEQRQNEYQAKANQKLLNPSLKSAINEPKDSAKSQMEIPCEQELHAPGSGKVLAQEKIGDSWKITLALGKDDANQFLATFEEAKNPRLKIGDNVWIGQAIAQPSKLSSGSCGYSFRLVRNSEYLPISRYLANLD